MVTVTYVDMGGFIKLIDAANGSEAADALAKDGDDIRTIKSVYGTAAQQQAFWRRITDRNNVEGGN